MTKEEGTAIVFYTSDTRAFGGDNESPLYKKLNTLLSSRDFTSLVKWKPFLFYLLSGNYSKIFQVRRKFKQRNIEDFAAQISSKLDLFYFFTYF